MSATRASVVSIRPAMDAAFCSARRVTLAGSMTPALTMSPYSPVSALKPKLSSLDSRMRPTHHSAFVAGVQGDLTHRLFERALDDVDADGFVVMQLELVEQRDAADQSHAAAGNDAFLDCRACGVHGVFDASLLFLQLGFGCRAHLDHRNAADQLGQALLELFAGRSREVVSSTCARICRTRPSISAGLAGAFDDRGVVLVDGDFLGAAEVLDLHVLELDAEVFGDGLAAGEGRDVFEHGLAAIAEAGGLDGGALQRAAQLVHDQGRQGFAFNVFGDDQQRLAHLGDLFEQGEAGPSSS